MTPRKKEAITITECLGCWCSMCQHEWVSKVGHVPKRCPGCGKLNWHIPKDERAKPGRPAKKESK